MYKIVSAFLWKTDMEACFFAGAVHNYMVNVL